VGYHSFLLHFQKKTKTFKGKRDNGLSGVSTGQDTSGIE
jgi:hypothetical protein